ncbi:MAG: hypothetical protein QM504_01835 [Pseudomonadota bacterium]
MEISNPIATQYVTNQGLASQLNAQNKQLPVKSDRFSVDNKIPAPTEDEQRLRSKADKKNKTSTGINDNSNNTSVEQPTGLTSNQELLPLVTGNAINLADNSRNFQQQPGQDAAIAFKQKEPVSAPIQSYLETSALNSGASQLSRIDFFV